MKSNHRTGCFLIGVLGVAILMLGGWLVSSIVNRVASLVGPADPNLPFSQEISLAIALYPYAEQLVIPTDVSGSEQEFMIAPGESTTQIINRLEQAGLVANAAAFRALIQYTGIDRSIQAGTYLLNPNLSPLQLAYQLQDTPPGEAVLAIFPGWRVEEIADSLPLTGLKIPADVLLQITRLPPQGHPLAEHIPPGASLEGFLLPGTYPFKRSASAYEVVWTVLDSFDAAVSPELRAGFSDQGLDLFEAVTLASIIEREVIVDDEMPLVASVFLNRLAIEMRLDADPTVQYAVGYQPDRGGWWVTPLSRTDLGTDSPYNTYRYTGLPPGPISSPSLSALQAVAYPTQSGYYYFRAACDGSGRHNFAVTLDEHNNNACP